MHTIKMAKILSLFFHLLIFGTFLSNQVETYTSNSSSLDLTEVTTSSKIIRSTVYETLPSSYTETDKLIKEDRNISNGCEEIIHYGDLTSKETRNIITVCLQRINKKNEENQTLKYEHSARSTMGKIKEFLNNDDIEFKCILRLDKNSHEKLQGDTSIYAIYVYSKNQDFHGIIQKNNFVSKVQGKLQDISANISKITGFGINCYYSGMPSEGFLKDYLAIWITTFAIASAGVFFIGVFKLLRLIKTRNAPEPSSVCPTSYTRKTNVSEHSINEKDVPTKPSITPSSATNGQLNVPEKVKNNEVKVNEKDETENTISRKTEDIVIEMKKIESEKNEEEEEGKEKATCNTQV